MQRKLIVYIAMSLDGFIATKDDDLSFLSMVEKEGEDYGYARFMETIDVVILGRRTYDKVLSMGFVPHPDKEVFVLSRTEKEKEGSATFYNGSLKELVQSIRQKEGKHIFLMKSKMCPPGKYLCVNCTTGVKKYLLQALTLLF
jgi:dihydrofolate reductase